MAEIARKDQLIIFIVWICAVVSIALSAEGKIMLLLSMVL